MIVDYHQFIEVRPDFYYKQMYPFIKDQNHI